MVTERDAEFKHQRCVITHSGKARCPQMWVTETGADKFTRDKEVRLEWRWGGSSGTEVPQVPERG